MSRSRLSRPDWAIHVGVVTILSMIVAIVFATLPHIGIGAERSEETVAGVAVSPVLSYQGRVVNPTTGAPQNGTLSFSLRLYNVASGGVALWTENKDIAVTNGLFSTHLGDTVAIPTSIFNGQDLWLGIKVASDAEATPRQRLLPVAYAMYADNADRLDGVDSAFLRNGDNINAGIVGDAYLPAPITRDDEVMAIVTASDGSGSGVDADTLDGWDSTNFFRGARGVQLNADIGAGASVTWTSWGWSPDEMVVWWALPRTQGGKLSTTVETHLEGCCGAGQGLITYWITVQNTSGITTNYDLVRYQFNP